MGWTFKYPYKFGPWYWFKTLAMLAPYWAQTDTNWGFKREAVNRFYCSDDGERTNCSYRMTSVDPKKWSSVYYRVYDNYKNTPGTKDMLLKASQDVHKYHDEPAFKNFKATWVLVVTWVRLYPNDWWVYDRTRESLYFESVSSLSSSSKLLKRSFA